MRIEVEEPSSGLAKLAAARTWRTGRRVAALSLDGQRPTSYLADEVVVDAEDRDLIERMIESGARVVRDETDPELPEEFRRAGLGREEPVDTTGLPRSVKLRFERVPEARNVQLERVLERAELPAERLRFSDPGAHALAALIAPARAEGRGVWLNELGVDHKTLPLHLPKEGAAPGIYTNDPLTWPTMTGAFRIADAWQLIETLRLSRSASGTIFIAVVDSGFWFDAPNTPGSGGAQTLADLGTGLIRWNTVDDVAGVPTGPGRTNWHGTMVASSAAAAVGNTTGAAGSGGTVARVCYFYDDRSSDSAKTAMIRCAQWGIPLVVYSGGFTSTELFFGTSSWNDTFNWAADNGVLMVTSAGNDNLHLPDDAVLRPATRTPRTLTVGATNDDGTKASFSNHGSSVNLWAPGVNIPVVPTNTPMTLAGSAPSGTSFSAPLVAGVAAMIRFANPTLNVDQLRDTLVNSGWNGAGAVGNGLDAYAAVWSAMSARMAEDVTEAKPEQLFPHADGTFEPIFNDAVNRTSDRDEFLLDVSAFSTLTVDLRWYDRLARVRLLLETTDPDGTDPDSTLGVPAGAGSAQLTAVLGSGRYRIVVQGSGPTAYLLSGRLAPGRLMPDEFEPNDSFDAATRLQVARPSGPFWVGPLLGVHGPGAFPLTLHTSAAGPATTDQDHFRVDVPEEVGALRIPKVIIGSDEQVEVSVYDAARTVVRTFRDRAAEVVVPKGTATYVRVTGALHTRYTLWVGAMLDADALRRSWQEELRILPDWWEDVHPEWVIDPVELRGVLLGEEQLRDGELVIGEATTGVLPESARVTLLDDAGEVVREGVEVAGRRSVSLEGLAPGPYVLQVAADPGTLTAFAPQPPLALG